MAPTKNQKWAKKAKKPKKNRAAAQKAVIRVTTAAENKNDTLEDINDWGNEPGTGDWEKESAFCSSAIQNSEWSKFYVDTSLLDMELKANRIRDEHQNWPWKDEALGVPDRVVTQAPFAPNEYRQGNEFMLPEARQKCGLFDKMARIGHPVLDILLLEGHVTLAAFASTCQAAFKEVMFHISRWDVTRQNFSNAEVKLPMEGNAGVGRNLVVSPFRVRGMIEENYTRDLMALQKMAHACYNYPEGFQVLHLHRVPFLTTDLLALVVPYMRKLKMIGIYRCELIHLGHTEILLDIVNNDLRGAGMTKNISLDFYPRFHHGPMPGSDRFGVAYTGAYGVTWDNFHKDSRIAVWAILSKALQKAYDQDVDLTSPGKALRFWLDKSPCWKVDDTLKRIYSFVAAKDGQKNIDLSAELTAYVNYHTFKGKAQKLRKGKLIGNIDSFLCTGCQEERLGVFFDPEEYYFGCIPIGRGVCLGCQLIVHLNKEKDHGKAAKRAIVLKWLRDDRHDASSECVQDDLLYVLQHEKKRLAGWKAYKEELKRAAVYGSAVFGHIGWDVETQESHSNHVHYSPRIDSIQDKKDYVQGKW